MQWSLHNAWPIRPKGQVQWEGFKTRGNGQSSLGPNPQLLLCAGDSRWPTSPDIDVVVTTGSMSWWIQSPKIYIFVGQLFGCLGASQWWRRCVWFPGFPPSGYNVTVLVRDLARLPADHKAARVVVGDVLNKEDVKKTMEGQDAVVIILGTRNNLS